MHLSTYVYDYRAIDFRLRNNELYINIIRTHLNKISCSQPMVRTDTCGSTIRAFHATCKGNRQTD